MLKEFLQPLLDFVGLELVPFLLVVIIILLVIKLVKGD